MFFQPKSSTGNPLATVDDLLIQRHAGTKHNKQLGRNRALLVLSVLGLLLALPTGRYYLRPSVHPTAVTIPAQTDWIDYGPIFGIGELGEWDYQLYGGFAGSVLKKDGVYYLYYQGARGYRTTIDETVTWRAIGVATSPDGINFTKAAGNPVLTWFPNNDGEEGAVSSAATLDARGNMIVYYGANTHAGGPLVNADGRMARSADGLTFTDVGIALDHTDRSLWGSGDELFPIIAFHEAGQWFVYYIPNGTLQRRQLGVAWGDNADLLNNSAAAKSGMRSVAAWGMGGYAKLDTTTYALFLNNIPERKTEVRTVALAAPDQLSAPVATYQFEGIVEATVLLDQATRTWFMYYRAADVYCVKLAPAGAPDTTPPTAPSSVVATPIDDRTIELTWAPATDAETGIVQYNIFRNGIRVATVKGWHFRDQGLAEQTDYHYTVSAINYHGVEGAHSSPITATSLPDVRPPRLVSGNASGNPTAVTLVFDEPLAQASAESAEHYSIDHDVAVLSATLQPDGNTVVLNTTPHRNGATYHMSVGAIRDRASTPNLLREATLRYTYVAAAGLVGAWSFEEGTGDLAFDTATFGNHGALRYTDQPGPIWVAGAVGQALRFDGVDDHVTIDGTGSLQAVTGQSYTFQAWANPAGIPPNKSVNDTYYTLLARQYNGLYYDVKGRFRAQIRLRDGADIAVVSSVMVPESWYQLRMVVDDIGKQLHLYVNGQEVANSPVSYQGELANHGAEPYYIGTSDPLFERYEYRFKGKLDEVQIYNQPVKLTDQMYLPWAGK